MPGMLHVIPRVDDDLNPLVGVRHQQHLLVQPEVPAIVRVGRVRREVLLCDLPERCVVGEWRVCGLYVQFQLISLPLLASGPPLFYYVCRVASRLLSLGNRMDRLTT